MTKAYTILGSLVFGLFYFASSAKAQTLPCNDRIHVTVNHSCAIELSVDAFLEGDVDMNDDVVNGLYTYELYNHTGILVEGDINGPTFGGDDLSEWINSLLFSKVFYNQEAICWGTVLLEDKNPPVIDCGTCPPVNGYAASDYNPECVRSCYEADILLEKYDEDLRDRIVPEDIEDFESEALTDNCGNWETELIQVSDFWTDLGPCIGHRLKRTWTVGFYNYDNTVSSVTCSREYFFEPFVLEEVKEYAYEPQANTAIIEASKNCLFLPVKEVLIPCSADISPRGIAAVFDDPDTKDRDTDDNNVDPDELDIDLVVENNEGIPYAFPHYYIDGVGSGGPHPQAVDNEKCNLITGYSDNTVENCAPGCTGTRKVLREWTILDWCTGEFIHYSQIIKVVDSFGPEIDIPSITASVDPWHCKAKVHLPEPEHIFDNCDNFYGYSIGSTGGYEVTGDDDTGFILWDVPLGQHRIEYLSEDCCGNIGRAYLDLIVVDDTPPVAVSKEFIVISLTNISNPINGFQGTAKLFARDLDNGSYDGCSEVEFKIRRDDTCRPADAEWGDFVSFCCEDLEGFTYKEIDVELQITDANGNENLVWATVRLEDKSSAYPTVPPHMILTCDMDISNFDLTGGLPRFYGACGESVVACDTAEVLANTQPRELRLSDGVVINGVPQESHAYNSSCGSGALRRDFRACGGGVQWFIIRPLDPFDNTAIIWPDDKTVDCDNYDFGEPEWPETTCNFVGVSLESDTFMFEDNACMKIVNNWSIIDWCIYDPSSNTNEGIYHHVQFIHILDNRDPVITAADSLKYPVFENCTSENIILSASAMDDGDCGSDWIRWELSIDAYSDWTEDFYYSSNISYYSSNGEINPFHIPKSGNGEEVRIELPDGIPGSKSWHRALWRAYDGCGNTSSKIVYFQITDLKAPTPYCVNLSTAVMENGEVELWAIDFDRGSFDNCSSTDNLFYTFTEVAPPARNDDEYDSNADLQWYNGTFWYYNSEDIDPDTGAGEYEDRDDYGAEVHRWEPGLRSSGKVFTADDADSDGFVDVPIYVWDECENIDFCLVTLRLVDNGGGSMAMVAGQVSDEFGAPVENVRTELLGPLNFQLEDMTDDQGTYAFADTPFYSDYKISASRDDDYINGVSTLDLVLMQRHILSQATLDSPYKMIAADINNDKSITAVDLLELRKLILGIYTELPNNHSWKAIDASNALSINDPWSYRENITLQDLQSDRMNENFTAVKIGDLNGSAESRLDNKGISGRSNETIDLLYEDRQLREGDFFELNLEAGLDMPAGMQFALRTRGLELITIENESLSSDNYFWNGEELRLSWHSTQSPLDVPLKVIFKTNKEGSLSELIELNPLSLAPEIYDLESLKTYDLRLTQKSEAETYWLGQNFPNPMNDFTVIPFEMAQSGNVSFDFYSLDGKMIKSVRGSFNSGYNTIKIVYADFPGPGMYYYTMRCDAFSATKQIAVIK